MTTHQDSESSVTKSVCSQCGQPAKLKRIDAHYISHEIQHLLHFEKGLLLTVKELLTRPGETIKEHLTVNRNRHIKPIPFLIFTSLIYTLISHYFHLNKAFEAQGAEAAALSKSSISTLFKWLEGHYGYANIMMGGLIALWIKVFFRRYQYNIFEITILLCFVMGEGMLLLAVETLVVGLIGNPMLLSFVGFIIWFYAAWAIGQFFENRKASGYIKAFLAYTLGSISFYAILFIIGIVYDLITR
ncbi:MAG: DUF3667 domain-containing protein [Bacteroidia bacterium]|nr:DUF3667 domain-containing protein [Bacteroidia bacterium]